MIFSSRKLLLFLATPLLTQCGGFKSAPPTQSVTGPFDSRGNYVEAWVNEPDKWYRPPAPGSDSTASTAVVSNTIPEPQPPVIDSTPPPVVKSTQPTVTNKPKPKPTPKAPTVVRHTVKRGDTLSSIARRYGSTVSKIQRANGISGSMIRVGQTLKIPK